MLLELWLHVDARAVLLGVGREEEVRLERGLAEGLLEQRRHAAAVLVVGDAAAVVALARAVAQRGERHIGVGLEEELRLAHADAQVGRVELVLDVPTNGPVLAPLLDDGVEEAQPVDELLEGPRVLAAAVVEKVHVVDRVGEEGAEQVGAQPLGRLVGHLDAVLQDGHGELVRGPRGEPQPELGRGRVGVDVLADLLERGHPGRVEVAVLQHDPAALLDGLLRHRVLPRREHEDHRRDGRRVLVAALEVKRRRLDVGLAEVLRDKGHHHRRHLVGPQAAQHTHALEGAELLPLAGQRHRLRLGVLVDVVPALCVLLEVGRGERLEAGLRAEADHLRPARLLEPVDARVLRRAGGQQARAARQEEHELRRVELAVAAHDLGAHDEGEERLVLLVERAADHAVDVDRVHVREVHEARRQVVALGRVVDGALEEADVPRERELVHGVDARHVGDAEEEQRGAEGRGDVAHARLVEAHPHPLGLAEHVDGPLVVEDVALALAQRLEDLVLDVLELPLVVRRLEHEPLLLLLQLGPLLGHHDAEQLVLQPLGRDHEVEQRHLDGDLGHVVRVAQLGRHEELEVLVVLDGAVAQLDRHDASRLEDLLKQHGLEHRVELLAHVLEQRGLAELQRVLEHAREVAVGELERDQAELAVAVLDPLVGLHLRVDHERPAARLRDHDAVVDGEHVVGQPVNVPRADLDRVAERRGEREGGRARDLVVAAQLDPLGDHAVAEDLRERAHVRDHARGDEHVAREVGEDAPQVGRGLAPARLLAAEATHELLRAVELLLAVVRLCDGEGAW
eukprot:scaffold32640_cov63-Phaeocystis_antarctica.AAC.2